jgi:hypothetical protein
MNTEEDYKSKVFWRILALAENKPFSTFNLLAQI